MNTLQLVNLSLQQADLLNYSKCFATYRKNVWFRRSWDDIQQMMMTAEACYWICENGKKIGGISLSELSIGSLFLIPPYELSSSIVKYLKEFLIDRKPENTSIEAYNVLPEHLRAFQEEGFAVVRTRKCMIRPTESLIYEKLPSSFAYVTPSVQNIDKLAVLLNEAFRGTPDEQDAATYREGLMNYFTYHSDVDLLEASTMIWNHDHTEIVGVCLVSNWEESPLIYDVAVNPLYRGKGIATFILSRAISTLEEKYPVIRLFVTSGNGAEQLYAKLGFYGGDNLSHLVYK
ncbi:hypothetical protein BVG16_27035 [Paenibacillus selenitireducens]|uniref:N-acetyltransferase domain-containing protein n=1 Tax=Paenibacillus selenitireducens TaxID=1324314 RepID=A0A1T2X1P7_9BACL|nr:GNAT family N-acetyltransferase [Paenibacillus selenitireducens]OPA73745.1 hypothetical protein BVG16_27035 [Paenibacillus selenitireducens]